MNRILRKLAEKEYDGALSVELFRAELVRGGDTFQVAPDDVVGPTYSGDSRGGRIREISAGDIVVIPAGALHAWTEVPEQVTYLGIRPDPHSALPAGYINPRIH